MDGGYGEPGVKCIELLTDSRSAKFVDENLVYHGRSKHIRAKWYFIRKRVQLGRWLM